MGGGWARKAGKGGRWGGAPESSVGKRGSSVGATKSALVPHSAPENITIGLIWLVTRGGGGRRGGGWAREAGKGTREQC